MSFPAFDDLVAEGESVPVEGWDFSWFEGRATENRPSWGYSRLMAARMAAATTAVDLQTGGGEVLAEIPSPPPLVVAEGGDLRFADASFDLVVSRHPTTTRWDEIARVLRPGGTYLSQGVGDDSVGELTEAMMGPWPPPEARAHDRAAAKAVAAGLSVVDLRHESLRMEFFDVAAVVHFLRKVVWIVPGFTVGAYRDRLAEVDRRIRAEGSFVAHSARFLIEARRPG